MNVSEFVNLLNLSHEEALGTDLVRSLGAVNIQVTEHTGAMEYPGNGFSFAFKKAEWTDRHLPNNEWVLVAVHFFLVAIDNYRAFDGGLICGIAHSSSRAEAHQLIGSPVASGGGKYGMFNRWIDAWDRFDLGEFYATLDFGDNGIKKLTIMSLSEAERLK